MALSALEVDIILWYATRVGDYRCGDFSAPAVRHAIDHFKGDGGILMHDEEKTTGPRTYCLTDRGQRLVEIIKGANDDPVAVPMRLRCPACSTLHIDEGEFATKPHHTHACQECGEVWRPAVVPTVGVQFLPGFKNA